ncbi:hypothetical protein [Hydrogenophaga sp. 2FB]|uniref:hypothetical protein n=1 Tax=Hydrogenophaga sp. 2FB TaxID=2502187 RepID=UPI0010F80707|nr:hypothetical protein [Hydrogenophaga sp. 2FB]
MRSPNDATTTAPSNVCTRAETAPLAPHLFTLAHQAAKQVSHLSTTLDTQAFLDSMLEPENEEDKAALFAPLPQLLVLKHALNADMQRQVKALAHTTDALCACAGVVGSLSLADERVP